VQADLGELILEKLEEQGKQVFSGSILSEQRSQATDLSCKSRTDVLARVGREIPDARKDASENDVAVEKLCKTWNLTGSGCANLCLVVLEQRDECSDELVANNDVSDRRSETDKLVGDHVADSPALVGDARTKGLEKLLLDFLWRELLGDSNQGSHSQQTDRVLIIARELAVERDDLADEQVVLVCKRFGKGLLVRSSTATVVDLRREP
jgi:hypothetical protein